MPNIKDFSELTGRGTFEVEVNKWKNPLTIEYGYGYINSLMFFFWRVEGTTHTFRISYYELMLDCQGDYEKHVKEFLPQFRQEYLGWIYGGLQADWMREYHEQYKNFVEF